MTIQRFSFRFDTWPRVPLSLLGVRPSTSQVRLDDERLEVHFGPWHVSTPWSNVVAAEAAGGPFRAYRAIGPRFSLADRGLTFGTSVHGGVCIRFREPVAGPLAGDKLRHPAITVTVDDPDGLVAGIEARLDARS